MNRPRWIIDDTSEPGHIFCEHTQDPRLIGELLPLGEAPEDGDFLAAPGSCCLCKIRWLEDVEEGISYEVQDMYNSLESALKAHRVAKSVTAAAG